MPELVERARLTSAGVERAPCHFRGKGTPCQCWGRGRALPVLGDRARLASAWGLGRAVPVLA